VFNVVPFILLPIILRYQLFINEPSVNLTLVLGRFGGFVKEWAPLMLPVLYGSLGAVTAGLRSFTLAWREKLLDERVMIEATTGVALGVIAGLIIGLTLNSVGSFLSGRHFLPGIVQPVRSAGSDNLPCVSSFVRQRSFRGGGLVGFSPSS
jgi:hypothetical protein